MCPQNFRALVTLTRNGGSGWPRRHDPVDARGARGRGARGADFARGRGAQVCAPVRPCPYWFPNTGGRGVPLAQMICQAPVTTAIMMAAVRLRGSLNEDTFRETYSLHPSTADYSSLHQITSDYFVITCSYSFITSYYKFIKFNTSYYSLVLLHWYFVITTYYCILLHSLLHITAEVTHSLLPIHYFILLTGITTTWILRHYFLLLHAITTLSFSLLPIARNYNG